MLNQEFYKKELDFLNNKENPQIQFIFGNTFSKIIDINEVSIDVIIDKLENMRDTLIKPTEFEWKELILKLKINQNFPHLLETKGEQYYNYLLETFTPLNFQHNYVICSETFGCNKFGKNTYLSIFKSNNKWFAIIASVDDTMNIILNDYVDLNYDEAFKLISNVNGNVLFENKTYIENIDNLKLTEKSNSFYRYYYNK